MTGSSGTEDEGTDQDNDEWGGAPSVLPGGSSGPTSSRLQSTLRRTKRRVIRLLKAINEFMTIPMYAAAASLVVACTPPLQHTLDQHMQPVKGALQNAGSCSIPVTLIVLGAYFYRPSDNSANGTNGNGPIGGPVSTSTSTLVGSFRDTFRMRPYTERSEVVSQYPGETKAVFIAVLSRMVITPMVLLPLMAVFTTFDIHKLFVE